MSQAVIEQQTSNVEKFQKVISQFDPFSQEDDELVSLIKRTVMPSDIKLDILRADKVGQRMYIQFVDSHLAGPASIWNKMIKTNLLTWKSVNKNMPLKLSSKVIELKQDRSLFARLMIVTWSRTDVNLEEGIETTNLRAFHSLSLPQMAQSFPVLTKVN